MSDRRGRRLGGRAARTLLIAGLGLVGACAVSFPEAGYEVTDGGADGSSCDATIWFCANDSTYCSCSFLTPDQVKAPDAGTLSSACNNVTTSGPPWTCLETSTACICGPPGSPVLKDSTVVSTCCGSKGCPEPPEGLSPPTTCP